MADTAPSALQQLVEALNRAREAEDTRTQAALERAEADKNAAKERAETNKAEVDYKKTKQDLKAAGQKVVSEFNKIAEAGIKLAESLGAQATKGIELEYKNRLASIKSLIAQDVNSIASKKQIEAAEQSLSQAFVNVREGFQISANGAEQFAADLNKGFKTEFQPTVESFRALGQMGITTVGQMDAFRRATGRASLTGNQLASLYSKNTLSFLLYGNSFAKAAANAEKLGINLASVQAAQEGLVTNLDGTIDTVAQLNQLGANIDFGTLVRVAETEGPDALMRLVRASVPEQLMQSASTRALFKQLGISVEDYLKSGEKATSGADQIEKRMTEAAEKTGILSTATAFLTKAYQAGITTFFGLVSAVVGAIMALRAFSAAATFGAAAAARNGNADLAAALTKQASAASLASRFALGGLGLGIGVGGAMIGRSMAAEGNVGLGAASGALSGAIGGAMLGSAIPIVGTAIGAILGGLAGGAYAYMGKANDMFSAGYGSRTLVTPNGAFALNNADDIIAGTKLFDKGSLKAGSDNSDLARKVDKLIDALSNATTTINVGGTTQTVPRLQLVGVYSRNEVR